MLACDLKIGDVVTKVGEDKKYIVTSTKPTRGLPQYVTIMGPYGHADEVWVNFIDKVVGHLEINYIFKALKDEKTVDENPLKRMTNEEFGVAMIEGYGDLSPEQFERLVHYISAKLVKNLEAQKVQAS